MASLLGQSGHHRLAKPAGSVENGP